jgi:hypothetical protein
VIRICLPPEESQRLDDAFKVKDRIQIIRLASRGRPHQEIASNLAITPRTVQRWLRYCPPVRRTKVKEYGSGIRPAWSSELSRSSSCR